MNSCTGIVKSEDNSISSAGCICLHHVVFPWRGWVRNLSETVMAGFMMNVVICLYNNFFLYILCIPSLFLHYSSTHVQVYGSIGHAMLPQLASAQGTGNRCRLTNGLIASSHLDILSPPLHGLIMIAAVENLRISKLAIQATDWKLSCNC